MSGSTGSVVWWVCCVLVISFCVVLCTDTWARGAVSAVLVVGVLCAHHFVEECSNVFKACGCRICGNWTVSHCFRLDSAKYHRSWHVGYFKDGWEYFIIDV